MQRKIESIFVFRPEAAGTSLSSKLSFAVIKLSYTKNHYQSKPFQIEPALLDPPIDG